MAMYGIELTKPTIHEFLSHVAAFAGSSQKSPASGIPNSSGNERFAPFDPIQIIKA
jgi:hypothetical protein